MKVFTRDYRITGDYHPLWNEYFEGMKPCVLDIEATGLDRTRCKVILIGLLVKTENGVRITQFLAENHYEEPKVLDATMQYLEDEGVGCLITFNGYAYDIPFINARLDACMDGRRLHMYHFDLYRFLRKATDMRRRVNSMSQMSLEDHYGILSDRGDTITGKESVTLFDQYAISGNSTLEKIILTHNREDVLHLHRLMYLSLGDIPSEPVQYSGTSHITGATETQVATDLAGRPSIAPDFHSALAAYGFPAADGRFSLRPCIKQSHGGVLRITGEQIRDPFSAAYFPDADCPLTVSFSASTASFEIEAPVCRYGDEYYMDVSFLFNDSLRGNGLAKDSLHGNGLAKDEAGFCVEEAPVSQGEDSSLSALGLLRADPDFINGNLILTPRSINLISSILVQVCTFPVR